MRIELGELSGAKIDESISLYEDQDIEIRVFFTLPKEQQELQGEKR